MKQSSKIFVAGHRGLVGSAICRALSRRGFSNQVVATRNVVDLRDPVAVRWFFSSHQPEYVFLSAARVGGIIANSSRPVEFMLDNMRIEMNVIEAAKEYGVKKLLFLGTACAYPKHAQVPVLESSLLTGALEPTNECYALAKIAGIKLCEAYRSEYGCDFISAMPTNLYGVGDHYDLNDSHVIPGMIHRFHRARMRTNTVALWGSGKATREFLFSDDLAEACCELMLHKEYLGLVNISSGEEVRLNQLAEEVARVVGFDGEIQWDTTKPDGTPRRKLDSSKIFSIGWSPKVSLTDGLTAAYRDFCERMICTCQSH